MESSSSSAHGFAGGWPADDLGIMLFRCADRLPFHDKVDFVIVRQRDKYEVRDSLASKYLIPESIARNTTTKTPSSAVSPASEASASAVGTDRTIVDVDRVDFHYRTSKALHGVNLQIPEKKVTAFIGPSGCGKSTLLRCFNRMNDLIDHAKVTAGEIRIDGVNIHGSDVDVITLRKRVGMVFQKSNPVSEVDLRKYHLRTSDRRCS